MPTNYFLLDTHALIWFQENNPKIPKKVMEIIQETDNLIYFSQISLFEIGIKQKIGKLPAFYATVDEVYEKALDDGLTFLNIQNQHIYNYKKVPLLENHRDPFDRLLIATAVHEAATILSADKVFSWYNEFVKVFW